MWKKWFYVLPDRSERYSICILYSHLEWNWDMINKFERRKKCRRRRRKINVSTSNFIAMSAVDSILTLNCVHVLDSCRLKSKTDSKILKKTKYEKNCFFLYFVYTMKPMNELWGLSINEMFKDLMLLIGLAIKN